MTTLKLQRHLITLVVYTTVVCSPDWLWRRLPLRFRLWCFLNGD